MTASLNRTKKKDMVFTSGKTDVCTKDGGTKVSNTE